VGYAQPASLRFQFRQGPPLLVDCMGALRATKIKAKLPGLVASLVFQKTAHWFP
jgi:hypothetical protein